MATRLDHHGKRFLLPQRLAERAGKRRAYQAWTLSVAGCWTAGDGEISYSAVVAGRAEEVAVDFHADFHGQREEGCPWPRRSGFEVGQCVARCDILGGDNGHSGRGLNQSCSGKMVGVLACACGVTMLLVGLQHALTSVVAVKPFVLWRLMVNNAKDI